ncbi:MAG: hypothetical protein ACFKPT_25140 [Gloeotrichia echinulata GP01]
MSLNLQDINNFSLQYSISVPATSIDMLNGKNIYARLTNIIVPVIFNRPIISISVTTSVPAGKIWYYAGRCTRVTPTALGESFVDNNPLFLGKRNLILFESQEFDYTIEYSPPRWFIDVNLGIYQYNGPYMSLESELNTIKSLLLNPAP